jgi:hypothetical protein
VSLCPSMTGILDKIISALISCGAIRSAYPRFANEKVRVKARKVRINLDIWFFIRLM